MKPSTAASRVVVALVTIAVMSTFAWPASPDIMTVNLPLPGAPLGIFGLSFLADHAIPVDQIEGRRIVSTRMHLEFNTNHPLGSLADAATIQIDLQPPIEPFYEELCIGCGPGGTDILQKSNFLHVTGADLGWSGTGLFIADYETDFLNGQPILDFPQGTDFSLWLVGLINISSTSPALGGQFTNSFIEVDLAPVPGPGGLIVLGAWVLQRRHRARCGSG
jgi:hypothetical protein